MRKILASICKNILEVCTQIICYSSKSSPSYAAFQNLVENNLKKLKTMQKWSKRLRFYVKFWQLLIKFNVVSVLSKAQYIYWTVIFNFSYSSSHEPLLLDSLVQIKLWKSLNLIFLENSFNKDKSVGL